MVRIFTDLMCQMLDGFEPSGRQSITEWFVALIRVDRATVILRVVLSVDFGDPMNTVASLLQFGQMYIEEGTSFLYPFQ